jgi:hypothetical protein
MKEREKIRESERRTGTTHRENKIREDGGKQMKSKEEEKERV